MSDYASFTAGGYAPPAGYIRRIAPREADLIDAPKVVEYDLEYEDEVRAVARVGAGRGR